MSIFDDEINKRILKIEREVEEIGLKMKSIKDKIDKEEEEIHNLNMEYYDEYNQYHFLKEVLSSMY